MPEESKGELDLSNLDSLLKDLEKDLPLDPSSAPGPTDSLEVPELPEPLPPMAAPVNVPPPAPPQVVADPDDDIDLPVEDVLASPVPIHAKDEHTEADDMFVDEEDHAPHALSAEAEIPEEPAPEPPAAAAPPEPEAAPAEEISFEAALELDEDKPESVPKVESPLDVAATSAVAEEISFEEALEQEAEPVPVAPAPPPPLRDETPVVPSEMQTMEAFNRAIKARDFEKAALIGQSLPPSASLVFRQNLAGALYYSGHPDMAEQELQSLLKDFPYTISARRNLDVIRSAKT